MAFKFESLKIWKEAIKFVNEIYALTKKFPRTEKYGLTQQLNRAAVSISLNIAEGVGRKSKADVSRFIRMAIGSLYEVVTVLHLSLAQKYIDKNEFDTFYKRCEENSKILHGYKNFLNH